MMSFFFLYICNYRFFLSKGNKLEKKIYIYNKIKTYNKINRPKKMDVPKQQQTTQTNKQANKHGYMLKLLYWKIIM